jgi:O-antigen/teichoic acid export membrane protein
LFWQVTAGLCGFTAIPAVTLVLFGPDLFSLVFGAEWFDAGTYARWLALSWVSSMILQPSIAMLFTLELQRGQLVSEVLLLIGRVAGMLLGARIAGAVGVVAGFALATAVAGTLLVAWVALTARSVDRRFAAALERGMSKRGA